MKKSELRDKIKALVQQTYKAKTIDLDKGGEVTLDAEKFPVLTKFPKLKEVIIDLLTDQYEVFMTGIEWVAPRPTTFRIVLGNDENFMLIYTDRSWIAQVEGKKYYLLNIREEERAMESLARILKYGGEKTEEDKMVSKEPDATPVTGDSQAISPSPEVLGREPEGIDVNPDEFEPAPEETPAPEEETPEEEA